MKLTFVFLLILLPAITLACKYDEILYSNQTWMCWTVSDITVKCPLVEEETIVVLNVTKLASNTTSSLCPCPCIYKDHNSFETYDYIISVSNTSQVNANGYDDTFDDYFNVIFWPILATIILVPVCCFILIWVIICGVEFWKTWKVGVVVTKK